MQFRNVKTRLKTIERRIGFIGEDIVVPEKLKGKPLEIIGFVMREFRIKGARPKNLRLVADSLDGIGLLNFDNRE